jgi:hypothetical protein
VTFRLHGRGHSGTEEEKVEPLVIALVAAAGLLAMVLIVLLGLRGERNIISGERRRRLARERQRRQRSGRER